MRQRGTLKPSGLAWPLAAETLEMSRSQPHVLQPEKEKERGSSSCAILLLLRDPQALSRLSIDLQNDLSLCSFEDTLYRAQMDAPS